MKTKLDFLLYSPNKTGSTSLTAMLNMHRQISSIQTLSKEPNFFTNKVIELEDVIKYNEKFKQDNTLKFEKSTSYFCSEWAINNIKAWCKQDIKFISILRNPIDRFISMYRYFSIIAFIHKNEKLERAARIANFKIPDDKVFINFPTLDKLLSGEVGYKWVLDSGIYHKHLDRLYHSFDGDDILIIKYEDFKLGANKCLENICNFLEIDSNVSNINTNIKWNSYKFWQDLANKLDLQMPSIDLSDKEINLLKNYYNEHNELLEKKYGIANDWNK